MLDIFKKTLTLLSPVSGRVMDLSDVPDEVFAKKLAGDGTAVDSTGDIIVAPADGILSLVFRTNHAFGIITEKGVEILVHIGLDTIELKGEGFECLTHQGSHVKAGTPIIRIDRNFIQDKGYSLITPVLITNVDNVNIIDYKKGINVEAGKDAVLKYKLK